MSQYDFMAKLLIIGDTGVGKTNVLLKFTANTFVLSHITTIGIDFKSKTILVQGKKIRLQIWDTAGQQRFKTITQTYYKGAEGIILAYSVDDQNSFETLDSWLRQTKQHAPQHILIVVIATKADVPDSERKVTKQRGQAYAKEKKLPFFEVSAKENINIENLFDFIGEQVKRNFYDKALQKQALIDADANKSKLHKQSVLRPTQSSSQCQC